MRRNLYAFLILSILYQYAKSAVVQCDKPDLFQCDNGVCIATLFRCDGENDCGDDSDESNCKNYIPTLPTVKCATDEFQCQDRDCIPIEKFCDTKHDCPDSSDEYDGCVKELKCSGSRCKNGYCIKNEWVCDGVVDCLDRSDEATCENKTIPAIECTNSIDRYLCKNQRCIFLNATCNGQDDCGDGSDEDVEGCKKADSLCKEAKCEHFCRKTPTGAKCSCRSGYELLNNRSCIDIDECNIYGMCDQQCVNNIGSYSCVCQPDYIYHEDKKMCKADGGEAVMVFSLKSEIRGYHLDSKVYFPITRNLQHAVSVSLDANYVYWSDIEDGDEVIGRSLEDGSERKVIVTTGLNSPDTIAVDWITGNIYFCDSGYMHIGVCSNDGSYCTIIIKERVNKPRGLALLPSNGIMYWTEWGTNPRILMAGMDGKNSNAFITEKLEWPNALAIDYANNRLYWIDAKLKIIESIRLDGSDRRIVLHEVAKQPISLSVFENKLYWSDWASNTIQSCEKFTGKDWNILIHANSTVYGLHVYHSALKPKVSNPCNSQPCSQLCLLSRNNEYTCACTLDKELNSDQHTCRALKKKEHLVIAAGNTFIDYYHELLGNPNMISNITSRHVTAASYNPLTGDVLALDQRMNEIIYFDTSSKDVKTMMSLKNEIVGGMDFDYLGNNLYFSNIEEKTIEVHSLNTKEKTIFYFRDEPHDIAVVPEEGIMFVAFRENDKYRIDKMRMDGMGPRIQIAGNKSPLLGPKISLCYDRDFKRIFWSDQGSGRIESTTVEGNNMYLFRTGLSEPISLAILGEHIFWTQQGSKQLHWTDKNNKFQYQKRITLHTPNKDALHLVALHGAYINKVHECQKNNGNCSHVCLVSSLHSHICACPPNMMLTADNRTCSSQTACSEGEIKCGEHDICIKLHQRCDGVQDCPNGEDEFSNCIEFNSCGDGQFKCKNGECISSKKHCDSHYDCTDRSDEDNCNKKECEYNEFQCHDGGCISKYLVCDGRNDCPDLTDEVNCGTHTCASDSFMCDTRSCIPKSWMCDGDIDCPDGSDEGEKCQHNACSSEMFTCHDGRCIDLTLKCDGIDHCEDRSDEEYCPEKGSFKFVNCTNDEYQCYNTEICLPKRFKCDGIQHCPKNDDERNCVRCQQDEFVCDNRKCIPQSWVCDLRDDCGDKSDEVDCDGSAHRKASMISSLDCKEFRCSNGVCLSYSKVCDGISDCPDQSDESGKCSLACSKYNPCQSVCYKTPLGPICDCQAGYRLSADLTSCEDINECYSNVCSQMCHNTIGSFTCSCYEGYVLRKDKTSCKVAGPQMHIITVVGGDIRKLSPSLNSIEVIHKEPNLDISAIDVNAREETVYWSNDVLGTISKIDVKSKEQKTVTGLGRPEALAVDWVTDNVYFSNNDRSSTIKVCNLEEQKCAKIVTVEGRSKVMSINVDPKHGWLFWSQTSWILFDSPSSEIYRSDTVGSNMTAICYRNLGVVSEITIDYLRSRLYWVDSFLKVIESSDLDGSNREIFLKTNIHQPLSISIYEDSLYWLQGMTGHLQRCKLHDDKSCSAIPIGNSNIDKSFRIFHVSRQASLQNTCENNKCNHMCILKSHDTVCICQNGYPEGSKNKCIENLNTGIQFSSKKINPEFGNIRQRSGTSIGIIIAAVIFIIILAGYCYYQRIKSNFSKKNDLSIHFQNPSYERRNEIVASFNLMSSLPPGEHEYVNPVVHILKKKKKVDGKNLETVYSDQSDSEQENCGSKQNTRLIR